MTTVLFDLDKTLLKIDEDNFAKEYFYMLGQELSKQGLDVKQATDAVIKSVGAMYKNDGSMTNEDLFWKIFSEDTGVTKEDMLDDLTRFYLEDFLALEKHTKMIPEAVKTVKILKEKGYKLVLATNPLFPRQATLNRISWAGLSEDDFDLVTTYEGCSFSKPNPLYFSEVLETINVKPEDTILIGNDLLEDNAASKIGVKCHFITDNIIDRGLELTDFSHSTFSEFLTEIESWPQI